MKLGGERKRLSLSRGSAACGSRSPFSSLPVPPGWPGRCSVYLDVLVIFSCRCAYLQTARKTAQASREMQMDAGPE